MRSLYRFLFAIAALLVGGAVFAQSQLSPCADDFTNCFGMATPINGENYMGEFYDGKLKGQGVATLSKGESYKGEFKHKKFNENPLKMGVNDG